MAKTAAEPPGTAGSQFFVVTGADIGLPPDYALLGKVSSGMDVVDKIGKLGDPATEQPTKRVVDREGDDLGKLDGIRLEPVPPQMLAQPREPLVPPVADPLHPGKRFVRAAPASGGSGSPDRRDCASTRPASPSAARCFDTACLVTGSSEASSVSEADSRLGQRLEQAPAARVRQR